MLKTGLNEMSTIYNHESP